MSYFSVVIIQIPDFCCIAKGIFILSWFGALCPVEYLIFVEEYPLLTGIPVDDPYI